MRNYKRNPNLRGQTLKRINNYLKIQISGINTFRFINLLKHNNINLYNVYTKNQITYAEISIKNFKSIKEYIQITKVRVRIISRNGPFFYIKKNRNRYFFLIGLLVFIFINILSQKKLSKIEICGNKYYSDKTIYEFLVSNEINYGINTRNISCQNLENLILDNFDLLTFVSAHIHGNTLKITVKENDTGNFTLTENNPCNLVATKDGEIVSIITRAGIPAFKPGDLVKAGNIIVYSRVDFTNVLGENHGQENVIADADILIKTNTNYEKIINRKYEKKEYTGRTMMISGMKIGQYYICNSKEKCPFKYYDIETEYIEDFPVTYFYETYREYSPVIYEYTDEELIEKSNEFLDKYINYLQENSIQTMDKSVNISVYGESAIASGILTTIEPAFTKSEYIEDT